MKCTAARIHVCCCFASFDPLFEIWMLSKTPESQQLIWNAWPVPKHVNHCLRHLDEFIETPHLKMKNKRVAFNELLNFISFGPTFCCLTTSVSLSTKPVFVPRVPKYQRLFNHCQGWFTNPFFFCSFLYIRLRSIDY